MEVSLKNRISQIGWAIALTFAATITPIFTQPGNALAKSRKGSTMPVQQNTRIRAPEITGGRGWLNTDKPLSIAGLKGKVVLLDFWTYGCINCIHIIPDLKKLEAKYPNQLVVIGVHSAKFENEKETENIRRIILRYELEHPVYNDADFKVWQSYAVRAWPTQVLIDPAGYVIGSVSGEGNYDVIDEAVSKTVAEFRSRGELNEERLKLTLERAKVGDMPLAFPGKVLADARSDRLFIADSNHNRIVITKLDGTLLETVGNGQVGAADGDFDKASFYRPQGMALDGDKLYIADTANHLIREIDLKARTVKTLAGTGKQMSEYFKQGAPRLIDLSSPWDLQLIGRTLYIAMAGPHQIWKLDLDKQEISTFAGSGREARKDGLLMDAGFAQPSGITSDGQKLYIADSESNIIRVIDPGAGSVETIVGGDLFEFGDVDGEGNDVRLQHPLGVFAHGGKVLIADTYNHKIKELNVEQRTVKTLFGTRKRGQVDGASASFYEPGGLSAANGRLFVADTNNHAIRIVDLKTRSTSTLSIKRLTPPTIPTTDAANTDAGPNSTEVKTPLQRIKTASDGTLLINAELPAGYHLNPAAPQRYRVSVEPGEGKIGLSRGDSKGKTASGEKQLNFTSKDLRLPIAIPFRALETGGAEVRVQVTLFYCREDNTGTCLIKTLVWRVPIEVTNEASAVSEINLQGKLPS
ncbi:MAG TPA: thioredoxin-like domain-containing protein [Pyrinomonadaceae bacterium]|nr:thioredoxin-like domain-containing protein [Pyrinomonadaceae bacterium]